MDAVAIAFFVMGTAVIAQHLGLSEAAAKVITQVAKCPKCMSFWGVLGVLTLTGHNIFLSIGLSLLSAYLSYWFGLLLIWVDDKYSTIWERLNSRQRRNQ